MDLIYIDPPFATGADFSYEVKVGRSQLTKAPSAIEEIAYRDTWKAGLSSYLPMLADRLLLMRELLAKSGTIYIHIGKNVSHLVRALCDDVFGIDNLANEITWKRTYGRGDGAQGAKHHGRVTESILIYRSSSATWNPQYRPYTEDEIAETFKYTDDSTGERYQLVPVDGPGGGAKGNPHYEFLGVTGYWRYSRETMQRLYDQGDIVLSSTGRSLRRKRYLKDVAGKAVVDLWDDVFRVSPTAKERVNFPTQKSLALLRRIIATSSRPGDLVADFFLGSGTTVTAAEALDRRWIGVDLGRFAVQTSRKRMLDSPDCRPFEVLNLGRYERSHWQGADVGEQIGEYYDFIVQLYGATRIQGFNHLHGIKGDRMVHVGATDAPVTADELELAISECAEGSTLALDVLGWEWEMGLNPSRKDELAHFYEVDVHLLNIPREVMDQKAVAAGDIHFFELSVVELRQEQDDRGLVVEIESFTPAVDEYMAKKVGGAIERWSDWIDYWSIDFDYDGETFVNSWQSYRTRQDPSLSLISDPHRYDAPGRKTVVVKVIDIFGNDTTRELTVEVE